jgi:hypothetical protein
VLEGGNLLLRYQGVEDQFNATRCPYIWGMSSRGRGRGVMAT